MHFHCCQSISCLRSCKSARGPGKMAKHEVIDSRADVFHHCFLTSQPMAVEEKWLQFVISLPFPLCWTLTNSNTLRAEIWKQDPVLKYWEGKPIQLARLDNCPTLQRANNHFSSWQGWRSLDILALNRVSVSVKRDFLPMGMLKTGQWLGKPQFTFITINLYNHII